MVKDVIGYRFSPTGEELISFYLMNKILGKTWLVDEAISEINILSYLPELLPRYAKIRSEDLYWYFFYRIEYMSPNNKAMKRSTASGYWKPTGKDRKIRDKRGNGDEIGLKKTLVYHEGKVPNGVRTPWVMHEYHITSLPQNQRTFVVCQVKYKGEHKDISYGNNSSETAPEFQVEQPVQENYNGMSMIDLINPLNEQEDLSEWNEYFNPNMFFPNGLPQSLYSTQEDNQFLSELPPTFRGTVQHLSSDQEKYKTTDSVRAMNTTSEYDQPSLYGLCEDDLRVTMNEHEDLFPLYAFEPNSLLSDYNHSNVSSELILQENHNKHRPKKPLTGFIDCSSDSDTDAAVNHNKHRPKTGFIYYSSDDSGIDEAESISATSYKGSSSSANSVASSSTDLCKDLQTYADSSTRNVGEYQIIRRTDPSEPEVKHGISRADNASMEENAFEKKGLRFITNEAIERNPKSSRYVYLMNTIISFILLMVLIRDIISVILTVQA